jgi:hypothetical protein
MCDQTPQRYYVCEFRSFPAQTNARGFISNNGQVVYDLCKARLFHSDVMAIREGCKKFLHLMEAGKLPMEMDSFYVAAKYNLLPNCCLC